LLFGSVRSGDGPVHQGRRSFQEDKRTMRIAYHLRSMEQRVQESLAWRRFSMVLFGLFVGFALTLSMIGIYGVVSYLVVQGTRELRIRIALDASETNILNLVIRQGMLLAVSGIAIGLASGLAMARLMRGLLFGIDASDPLTYVTVCISLALIAGGRDLRSCAACYARGSNGVSQVGVGSRPGSALGTNTRDF
jgi:ABC-type antimicrobial peptide transport system permease subunit